MRIETSRYEVRTNKTLTKRHARDRIDDWKRTGRLNVNKNGNWDSRKHAVLGDTAVCIVPMRTIRSTAIQKGYNSVTGEAMFIHSGYTRSVPPAERDYITIVQVDKSKGVEYRELTNGVPLNRVVSARKEDHVYRQHTRRIKREACKDVVLV